MFDLDEGFHALQNLDAQGRKALVLAGKLWEEIYRDENQHVPASHIVNRYLTELSERSQQARELRERLSDVLDSREQAEIRAEEAESLVEKMRAWIARWGLATELDLEMPYRLPDRPHEPSSTHRDRPDECDAELLLRHRQLSAAREAERRAFRIAEHERDRALGAERRVDELHDEVSRLRSHLDF